MIALTLMIAGYMVGRYRLQIRNVLDSVCESLTNDLPETSILPIVNASPSSSDSWAIAGYYLVKTSVGLESQYLTSYSRWLMGINADVIYCQPAKSITSYTAFTPNGASYNRTKTTRVYHVVMG